MESEVEQLYEPLSLYATKLKDLHAKNVSDYFENLVKESGVSEDENAAQVARINSAQAKIAAENRKTAGYRSLRAFLVFLAVIAIIAGFVFGYMAYDGYSLPVYLSIIIAILCLAAGIGFILLIALKVNKIINHLDEILTKARADLSQLISQAWTQMAPLNRLFEWNIAAELTQKTIPLVQMDRCFDSAKYDYLRRKYSLRDTSDPDNSVLFVQSGHIVGNPFLIARTVDHKTGSKTYTGSIVIHWTETIMVNGHPTRVSRSQTLTASVSKPFPEYYDKTYLIYGNDAAIDLSFSRQPSGISGEDERKIDRFVEHKEKQLDRLAEKSVKKGGDFTQLANSEFEALFNALDRDNEVEFRLLFTPLAQQEMVKLIKDSKIGYGDDFAFFKRKGLNYIFPLHLNNLDFRADPAMFESYDLKDARKKFNSYNNEYFRSMFFGLAPILAIPLYQQYKPREFIYRDSYPSYLSCWEHESTANSFDPDLFRNPESVTRNIIKTSFIEKDGDSDKVAVASNGFRGVQRTDYISMIGGDGMMHRVPVNWIEYQPVSKVSTIGIAPADKMKRSEYYNHQNSDPQWKEFFKGVGSGSTVFRNALLAFVIVGGYQAENDAKLKKMLGPEEKQ